MSHERLYSPGPENIEKTQRLWIEPVDRQEFAIGREGKILLTLRSQVAENIYNLLRRKIVDDAFHDAELNCHATAAIALGESTEIRWGYTKKRGKKTNVQEALTTAAFPCGMQIHNYRGTADILHSAVLLGSSVDMTPLAFHKNGTHPMELCTLADVLSAYHHNNDNLTFYEASNERPGKFRKFLQWWFSPSWPSWSNDS